MNKSGGTLFIGVADNSEITGIEVEVGKTKLRKSLDKYMNTIKDILKKESAVQVLVIVILSMWK